MLVLFSKKYVANFEIGHKTHSILVEVQFPLNTEQTFNYQLLKFELYGLYW